ncbi:MAG: DUF4855 domain-containing protein [Muribaculaceae bacterium]|nr:DUF4855 domain-containing protein [Muribaculaceae bacterium]
MNCKLLLAALLSSLLLAPAALCQPTTPDVNRYGTNNQVSDMIAIYYARENRLQWTTEHLTPYVTHTFQDGHTEWLFQGFMFIDFVINNRMLLHHKDTYQSAVKSDWQQLLEMPFTAGRMFDALDQTISSYKQQLGAPPFRHKVVMGIPIPIKNQTNWGRIGNRNLDFSRDDDRVTAIKWFIDEFLKEYKKHHYRNFDLDGFYWVEEDMEQTNQLATPISAYLHRLGYKHYWMPYLKAFGSTDWQPKGFDYCYTQPGSYCCLEDRDTTIVVSACQKAKRRGMGLVMEINEKLFGKPDVFIPRINKCIDIFEQYGVYDQAAMSYYDAERMIYCIREGKLLKHTLTGKHLVMARQVMDRMAQHIVDRYKRRYLPAYTPTQDSSGQGSGTGTNSGTGTGGGNQRGSDDWRNPDYWHF